VTVNELNANEGCNSCASLAGLVLSFIACFILLVIALAIQTDAQTDKSFRRQCSSVCGDR